MINILNIAYYREEDWNKFLNSIDDRDRMPETWHEWHESYLKARNGLKAQGFKVRKIVVDIDELQQYCMDKGIKNNGQARSMFVTLKKR
jgi:hypothetical protein